MPNKNTIQMDGVFLVGEGGFDLHFLSRGAKENKGVDPVEPGSSDSFLH
ncbi:MAG: hypothetical protein IJZ39_04215 [Oscillospiraceae bacterium]|nr:hypothetical protein [Oscillospiraceae bacterium]